MDIKITPTELRFQRIVNCKDALAKREQNLVRVAKNTDTFRKNVETSKPNLFNRARLKEAGEFLDEMLQKFMRQKSELKIRAEKSLQKYPDAKL